MKAIVQDKFGSPEDVLKLKEIGKPMVEDDGVLVRVHAASIHIGDVQMTHGGSPWVSWRIWSVPGLAESDHLTQLCGWLVHDRCPRTRSGRVSLKTGAK